MAYGDALAATAEWINNTANTPDTAYDWDTPSNWKGGYVGGTDASDQVTIAPTAKVYIKVPDSGVLVNKLLGGASADKAFLLGGNIYVSSYNKTVRGEYSSAAWMYGSVVVPSEENWTSAYLSGNFAFCSQLRYMNSNVGYRPVISSGTNRWRLDMFADAAGEDRTLDAVVGGNFGLGSGTLVVHAPVGAAAVSGTWRLTSGSPYAYRVSSTAHALAVGTTVTSSGNLPAGTFLKRVFDNATIELSEVASTSGNATLEFDAFTPNCTVKFATFYQQGSYGQFFASKTREQDVHRVEFNDYYMSGSSLTYPGHVWFGENNNGIPSGTFVFHKITVPSNTNWEYFNLRHVGIEFAGAGNTGVTEVPSNCPVTQETKVTSTITVTNNITGIINVFTNFQGTVIKDGGGTLRIGFGEASNAGSLVVAGGTLQIVRNATVGEGATLSVDTLAISNGATFMAPEGGMTVKKLVVEPGATLAGPNGVRVVGERGVTGDEIRTISCPDGAKVCVAFSVSTNLTQFTTPTAQVVGHPAFWLDASMPETVTTNSTGGVTRWNDCRVGEPMFCTNVASAFPTYVCGDSMRTKYVKIAKVSGVSEIKDTQMLVWSEPIYDVKAVFLVQDPVDGGGEILGRTSARLPWRSYYGSQGGPFYRGRAWYNALVNKSDSTPCVLNGRFFVDGVEVCGYTDGFCGPQLQLVEFHVNTNFYARPAVSRRELACDAFGFGYEQPHSDISNRGGMRIAEYIIYTNTLTHVERLKTAQYLMRKWLGRNVYCSVADNLDTFNVDGTDSVVDVEEGNMASYSTLNSGSLVKDGDGLLYVDGMSGGSLVVNAGETLVTSRTRDSEVPHDAVIHVDAADASTITKYDNTDKIKIWMDVNGTGKSLRPVHHLSASSGSSVNGFVRENAINGKPAIDLGTMSNAVTSEGLALCDAAGNFPPTRNLGNTGGWEGDTVQTAFFVYDSYAGGGCLLGGIGSQWPAKGMPHVYSSTGEKPIFYTISDFWTGGYNLQALSNACNNGIMTFKRNGEYIHPFEANFLNDVEISTFQYPASSSNTNPRRFDFIASSQDGYDIGSYRGGFKFGEIIIYSRKLSAVEVSRVEAYLSNKWSGETTPGYGAATADALSVASGATLKVLGFPFETAALSGAGTIDGDVKVTSGGAVVLNVASDGSFDSGMTVTGTADFSASGEIALTGNAAKLAVGKYLLVSAGEISPASGWTVTGGRPGMKYTVSVEGNSLYLTVQKPGLSIIVL